MTAPMPSRQQIAAAGDLDWDRKPKQDILITIKCRMGGYDTELAFSGSVDQLPRLVERLAALGAEPVYGIPVTPAAPAPRKAAQRVQPAYSEDGTEICPVHRKPLVTGRYGPYCPAKAQADEQQNDKGYCSLRFEA